MCVFMIGLLGGGFRSSCKGFEYKVETHGPSVRLLGDPVHRYREHYLIYLGLSRYPNATFHEVYPLVLDMMNVKWWFPETRSRIC
jgi:hypothetical protein